MIGSDKEFDQLRLEIIARWIMNGAYREMMQDETKQQAARNMVPGYGSSCAVPQDRREIGRLVDDLEEVAARYENLVARLSDKTDRITSLAPPECTTSSKDAQLSTNLGNHLESIRIRLRDSANNVESIIERIEL